MTMEKHYLVIEISRGPWRIVYGFHGKNIKELADAEARRCRNESPDKRFVVAEYMDDDSQEGGKPNG